MRHVRMASDHNSRRCSSWAGLVSVTQCTPVPTLAPHTPHDSQLLAMPAAFVPLAQQLHTPLHAPNPRPHSPPPPFFSPASPTNPFVPLELKLFLRISTHCLIRHPKMLLSNPPVSPLSQQPTDENPPTHPTLQPLPHQHLSSLPHQHPNPRCAATRCAQLSLLNIVSRHVRCVLLLEGATPAATEGAQFQPLGLRRKLNAYSSSNAWGTGLRVNKDGASVQVTPGGRLGLGIGQQQ